MDVEKVMLIREKTIARCSVCWSRERYDAGVTDKRASPKATGRGRSSCAPQSRPCVAVARPGIWRSEAALAAIHVLHMFR